MATELDSSVEAPLGELLREYREAAGLSQEALSARSGVSADTISQWERGVVRRPRRSTLKLLADALGLEANARQALLAAAIRPLPGPVPAAASLVPSPPARRPVRWRSHWRLPLLVIATSVPLVVIVVAMTLLAEARPAEPPLEIGTVDLRAVPSDVAHCPAATIVVEGTIGVRAGSGPGTIIYHWVHPDGQQGPDSFVHVPAGVQTVHVSLRLDYTGARTAQGLAILDMTAPNRLSSAPLTIVYLCP